MTSHDPTRLLRRTFAVNAAATAASGAAFLLGGGPLGPVLGLPSLALHLLGAAFLGVAVLLWRVARREPMPRREAAVLIANDVAYVVLSAVVLLGWPELMRPAGRIVFGLIADAVAVMAVLQYVGYRRIVRAPELRTA